MAVAKKNGVINPDCYLLPRSETFWQHFLADAALQSCEDLEKLLIGCEIIAALDDPAMLPGVAASPA